jgi:glycine cleavage system H protein
MEWPEDLLYTDDHEWLRADGDVGLVGITDYAQDQLGDVVFLELPAAGSRVERGEPFGVVESVKAVSELYAPVTGEVLARNDALTDAPEMVNKSPFSDAWMIRVRLEDAEELKLLLPAEEYRRRYEEK